MPDLFVQIQAFLLTLVLGIFTGLIFHYYQRTIAQAKVSKYPLYILDFFLWIIMICLVFYSMLWINQGEMRVYVLIALLAGLAIYYYQLATRLNKIVYLSASLTVKIISLMGKMVIKPFIKLTSIIKNSFNKKPPPSPPE